MDIQHLRHSAKVRWLLYYRQNRPWLVRVKIWGTYDGQRRPSSSFILAVVSGLEPQLIEMLPFIVDLSNDPDQIVAALGLNFNPDTELKLVTQAAYTIENNGNGHGNGTSVKVTHTTEEDNNLSPAVDKHKSLLSADASKLPSWVDESCQGKGEVSAGLVLSILALVGTVTAVVFAGFTG